MIRGLIKELFSKYVLNFLRLVYGRSCRRFEERMFFKWDIFVGKWILLEVRYEF